MGDNLCCACLLALDGLEGVSGILDIDVLVVLGVAVHTVKGEALPTCQPPQEVASVSIAALYPPQEIVLLHRVSLPPCSSCCVHVPHCLLKNQPTIFTSGPDLAEAIMSVSSISTGDSAVIWLANLGCLPHVFNPTNL